MTGKAEDLRTDQARQTRDTKDRASKGSSKVCVFPGKADAEIQMAKATAKRLNIPFVDPLRAAIEPSALSLLNPDVAIRRQALPIRLVEDTLLVAMASPEESIAIRSLEILTGCRIRPAAAPKSSLSLALQQVYEQRARGATKASQEAPRNTQENDAEESKAGALTVSVISNKGGVGKTHFAITLPMPWLKPVPGFSSLMRIWVVLTFRTSLVSSPNITFWTSCRKIERWRICSFRQNFVSI